jgi:hypothetical protein
VFRPICRMYCEMSCQWSSSNSWRTSSNLAVSTENVLSTRSTLFHKRGEVNELTCGEPSVSKCACDTGKKESGTLSRRFPDRTVEKKRRSPSHFPTATRLDRSQQLRWLFFSRTHCMMSSRLKSQIPKREKKREMCVIRSFLPHKIKENK